MRIHSLLAAAALTLGSNAFAPPLAAEELAIGATAPGFKLKGTDGRMSALADFVTERPNRKPAAAVVVVFTCNQCPFSKAYEPVLIELASRYEKDRVRFVLINSNDPEVAPGDSYEKMVELAREKKYPFPYLYDATQAIATAYGAKVTPHIFLLDDKLVLRYRGRINDSRAPEQVKSHDLVAALDAVLAGKEVATTETKAFGCTIKWKKAS